VPPLTPKHGGVPPLTPKHGGVPPLTPIAVESLPDASIHEQSSCPKGGRWPIPDAVTSRGLVAILKYDNPQYSPLENNALIGFYKAVNHMNIIETIKKECDIKDFETCYEDIKDLFTAYILLDECRVELKKNISTKKSSIIHQKGNLRSLPASITGPEGEGAESPVQSSIKENNEEFIYNIIDISKLIKI
jgi:hypothetical protein